MGRFPSFPGFDPGRGDERAALAPAAALAGALAALPFLLLLPLDADRAIPLAFLPAVWLGWKIHKPARSGDARLFAWAAAAMLLSAALSAHAARAFVMTAAVGWTLAGGLVARNLAGCAPAVRLVLGGLAAGAAAGTVMLRLGVDTHTASFPIYGSVRLFGAHQFAGAVAATGLLVCTPLRRSWRLLTIVVAALAWTGLFWSGSRAPVVAMAVATALWFWRGTAAEHGALLRWVPALAAVGMIVSLTLGRPHLGMGWSSAVERTVQAAGIEDVSSERSRFWAATWRYAIQSPVIGHGADGYRFIEPNQNGSQPHNVLLQWLLEYGVLGLVPLLWLALRCAGGLWRRTAGGTPAPMQIWASASLGGALAYGMLDGVFYHATIFMPVAVIAGLALGSAPPAISAGGSPGRGPALLRSLLLAGLAVLLLHGWLGFMLLRARNVSPDSTPARILRAFPSTTYGLQNWINAWRHTQPDLAMDWIHWAQTASVESASFCSYAAQIYIWQKDYKSAETELLRCLQKVHHLERHDVQKAIDTVRALEAGQSADQSLPPP